MVSKIICQLILYIFSCSLVLAQSSFIPKKLPATINSSWDEINPVLSADGTLLFFVRVNHPENRYGEKGSEDIWFSALQPDGIWSEAVNVATLNKTRYNAVLSALADGKTFLLNGIYNKRGNFWKKRGLSTVTLLGNDWSKPHALNVKKLSKKNRGQNSSASMSADGNYIVLSFSKRYNGKRNNLFISQKKENGNWSKPKKLKSINTRRSEEAPFLSADAKTLYYSCDCQQKGAFNIYKSVRLENDKLRWSAPTLLSDTINTQEWESYLITNAKGSYGYFSSTREKKGDADLFKVKLFEENPFVVVSGTFRNALSKRLLTGKTVSLLVNGKPVEGAVINTDSATYSLKLPLQKSYQLSIDVPHYTPIPETIDVSTMREFIKMRKDLKATPYPFVMVQGKLLDKTTGSPLPGSAKPFVLVNNAKPDSISINSSLGTYSLKLKFGASYSLQVKAERFESFPETIDLSSLDEYQEVTKDLFAEADKAAILSGKIIDKKTNQVFSPLADVSLKVEGLDTARAIIDSTGTYVLRLPLGKLYTISASAPNYYPVYETVDVSQEKGNVKVLKDLIIVPIEVGQSIRLNNIFFDPGKSILKKESFPELDRVAEFLTSNPAIKVEIAGHTDNVGKAASNQKLSLDRAKAVASYIVKAGIDKNRVVAKGYGSTKSVADNKTKEGKAQNRRVEFTILDN